MPNHSFNADFDGSHFQALAAGGTISRCYSTASAKGYEEVGGFAGINESTISDCYARGRAEAEWRTGGLVGYNKSGGVVSKCYSTTFVKEASHKNNGLVAENDGTVEYSFWDIEASGQTGSNGGGTGKSTADRQTESTFTDAGWDFVSAWAICEGTNYARFLWQIPGGDFLCPDGVNLFDFSFFAAHWLEDNCGPGNDYCDGTDTDYSGDVDHKDLKELANHWLTAIY